MELNKVQMFEKNNEYIQWYIVTVTKRGGSAGKLVKKGYIDRNVGMSNFQWPNAE